MQIMADSSLPSQPGPGHPATGARPPGPAGGCVLQVQVFGSNLKVGTALVQLEAILSKGRNRRRSGQARTGPDRPGPARAQL